METIVTALADQQAELSDLLSPLDEPGWEGPTRCEGWTVADVVLHLLRNEPGLPQRVAEIAHEFWSRGL